MTFYHPTDDDLDGDPVQALWRMEGEARAAERAAEVSDPSPRPV